MLQNNSNKQYIYCKTRLSILLAQGCDVCLLIETKFLQLIPEYTFSKSLIKYQKQYNKLQFNICWALLCRVHGRCHPGLPRDAGLCRVHGCCQPGSPQDAGLCRMHGCCHPGLPRAAGLCRVHGCCQPGLPWAL